MNNILIEKRAELLEVKQAIYAKQREIRNFSYESTDDEYDSYLDGCYGDLDVCGRLSARYRDQWGFIISGVILAIEGGDVLIDTLKNRVKPEMVISIKHL